MNKKYFITIAAAVALILGASAYFFRPHIAQAPVATTEISTSTPAQAAPEPHAGTPVKAATTSAQTVTISTGDAEYTVSATVGETVFDAMQTLMRTTDFSFTYKTYAGLGAFVESVNGKMNNNGSTWFFYINGTESPVGISLAPLKPGDTVVWKFEKNTNY